MATLTEYVNVGEDGDPVDSWVTSDYQEAKERARQNGWAVVAYEYEFSDTELLDDYRPGAKR